MGTYYATRRRCWDCPAGYGTSKRRRSGPSYKRLSRGNLIYLPRRFPTGRRYTAYLDCQAERIVYLN